MKLFFSPGQLSHRPRQYFRFGKIGPALENPNRMEALAEALASLGLLRAEPSDHGRAGLLAVHDAAYIAFLESIWGLWQGLPDAGPEALPNVHPYRGAGSDLARNDRSRNTGPIGLIGHHVGDMSCAIGPGTWAAAYASAQTALSAAAALLGGSRRAFALCRPPGHHCYRDRANGFCFLNNAAIAAEALRTRFGRVAILDFDTHHGDGTQAIFYTRGDILVASCHTDPSDYYPFFAGFADERGHGAGEGANLNIPLKPGAGDDDYLAAVSGLADAVHAFGAEALIISAGWDAHKDDPLSKLTVTSDAFPRIGERIARLGLPTLIIQEGGYSLAAISDAAPSFTGPSWPITVDAIAGRLTRTAPARGPSMTTMLDGKAQAQTMRIALKDEVARFAAARGRAPGLAVVLVGQDPASQVYVGSKVKQTEEVGMRSIEHRLPAETGEAALLTLVDRLNADPEVDGILVQLPLPAQIDADKVLNRIDPAKDVDGFHPVNAGRLAIGVPGLVPCTPLGSVALAKLARPDLSGLHAVVIGRSNIVGKPVAQLLLQENCTVTIAHSKTRDLPGLCRTADLLVAAIGRPRFVTADFIKPGAIVIDVGINRIAGTDGKGTLVGDVDFAAVAPLASAITPVPGGVGPMTIAFLLSNTLRAAHLRAD